MKSILSSTIVFSLGAAVGATAAWMFLKNKYEQQAREEIEAVREYYSNKTEKVVEENEDDSNTEPEEVEEYYALAQEYSGSDEKGGSEDMRKKPYVISPDEYGELEDYDVESLVYYADGVLADNNNEPIDNIANLVGTESLTHFGEYEDDSVFVRNDRLKCDYEILKDYQKYSDVINSDLEGNE